METKAISKPIPTAIIGSKPKFILDEKQINFGDSTNVSGCQRIHHCACDCNYIKCTVFFG